MRTAAEYMVLFVFQGFLEFLAISLIVQADILPVDMKVDAQDFLATFFSVLFYYSILKSVAGLIPYLVLMFVCRRVFKKLSVPAANLVVSPLVAALYILAIGDPVNMFWAGILATVFSALCIWGITTISQYKRSAKR